MWSARAGVCRIKSKSGRSKVEAGSPCPFPKGLASFTRASSLRTMRAVVRADTALLLLKTLTIDSPEGTLVPSCYFPANGRCQPFLVAERLVETAAVRGIGETV